MNIKARAELLKSFIEICDTEIFPAKPASVYVINKASTNDKNTVASYNQALYLKMLWVVPLMVLYSLSRQVLFLLKKTLQRRKSLISTIYFLRTIKTAIRHESYFAVKQKHLLEMDLIKIAGIACHEVRHRFQFYDITNKLKACENVRLLEVYNASRSKIKSYEELEIDARFVQYQITKRLFEKFPDGSFSKTDFRTFVQENKEILAWRNPHLKQF